MQHHLKSVDVNDYSAVAVRPNQGLFVFPAVIINDDLCFQNICEKFKTFFRRPCFRLRCSFVVTDMRNLLGGGGGGGVKNELLRYNGWVSIMMPKPSRCSSSSLRRRVHQLLHQNAKSEEKREIPSQSEGGNQQQRMRRSRGHFVCERPRGRRRSLAYYLLFAAAACPIFHYITAPPI